MPVQTNDDFDLLREFVHDLKTPLGAAMSFVDLIEQLGDLNDQQRHFSHRAHSALERLMYSINDYLEYARIEAARDVKIDLIDLSEIVQESWALLESQAEEHHIEFAVHIPTDAHFVYADRNLLTRIVENLLGNAVKYNRIGGEVAVTASEQGDVVQVDIRDTGWGVSEDLYERIFERFYRVERAGTKKIQGTGLGLAIVRGAVEQLGGQVWVKSTEDEGSTFSFTIKRALITSSDDGREMPDDLDDSKQDGREELSDSDSGDIRY